MKKYFFLIALSMVAFSCERENVSFEGPSLVDLNGKFGLLSPFTADKSSVDFSKNEEVHFFAEFTKLCDWEIVIRGKISGAQKTISGKSRNLNIPPTVWNGSTTIFPVFRTEPCIATLKIKDVADTFNVNIGINGVRKPQGLLISDFETGMNAKWTSFLQSGANMDFKIKTDANAVEGKSYLNMAGTVNWDWLIGLIDFNAIAYGTAPTFNLSSISDDVYFNCLIWGAGNNVNTSRVLFQFKEDDNGNGVFDPSSDDQFDKEIIVDWSGWKLISFKYNSLQHLVNGVPAANNGNNKHNSQSINKVSMLHLANPSGGFASSKIDFIIFTEKAPLEL